MRRRILLACSAALIVFMTGCETVPETGRRRLLLVSPSEELRAGLTAFEQIKQKETISRDAAKNERVQRIGRRIREAVGADMPGAQWEFVVFESKEVNAFALSGGKVGVYTGLLELAENDAEVAIVVGHEIAHVTLRHSGERMSNAYLAAGAGLLLALGSDGHRDGDLARTVGGLAIGGTVLAFSREHESEADRIGIRYAAKAGYDPRAAVTFWQKMLQKSGRNPGITRYFSTHPLAQDRIAALQGWMPETLPYYEAARRRYGE